MGRGAIIGQRERDERDSHPGLIKGKIGKSWGRVKTILRSSASMQVSKPRNVYIAIDIQQTVHFQMQVGIHK